MHKIGERICKHYNGRELIRDGVELCQAGVNPVFLATGGERFGWVRKAPCFEKNGFSEKCDKCEFPTQEEMDKQKAEWDKIFMDIIGVVALIPEDGFNGTVECPKCKGVVDWARAKSNGHRHARCQTKDCLSFME
jgi:hypothetical protein